MAKYIICTIFILVFVFNLSSCKTENNSNNESYNTKQTSNKSAEAITLEELKENSDVCIYISTTQIYENKNQEGQEYTIVNVIPVTEWQIKYFTGDITIIEHGKSHIEPDKVYIAFLSKSENDDEYYLNYGKSGIFTLDYGKVKPLDYKMKKEVKTQWDNKYENFEVWFSENYEDPALTPEITDNLPENSAFSSEIS